MIKFGTRAASTTTTGLVRRLYSTKLERAASESRDKLIKWVVDTKPALTDEEVLSLISPLARPFAKQRMSEMRQVIDHYASIRDGELIRRGLMQPTERKPSFLLQLFGYYRIEHRMEQTIENIWDILEQHIASFFPSSLYKSMNLPTPEENWLNSEFYIWTLHLWALYRRLRFEGKDGELVSDQICDRFWKLCEDKLSAAGIPGGIMHVQLRTMQSLHYGVCISLDEALSLDQDTDAIWAEVVWRNLYSAGYENLSNRADTKVPTTSTIKRSTAQSENQEQLPIYIEAKYLLFWVRYIRYLLSWMDHVDSNMLMKGLFELHSPTSDLAQGK